MNILFIHASAELYGSDRSLLMIIKYLDKSRYIPFVLLPHDGPLCNELKKIANVEVLIFPIAVLRRKNVSLRGAVSYFKEYIDSSSCIKRLIREKNIDVVYTNTAVVFPGAVVAKYCGIKSVWHVREIIRNDFENSVVSFMINRFADSVIVNSYATGKRLRVDQRKIKTVYNAIEEYPDTERQEHDGFAVGMAGRINRWKGQKLFVDAACIVAKRIPNVKFLIAGEAYAGEGYLKDELISYIEESGMNRQITLLGQFENMSSFYDKLDVFVLPSIQPEPFGLVVLEAMDFGIPVIATNHGGPTEIIKNGVNGYLVDYKDPQEMADQIVELLKDADKRQSMGEKGKEEKRRRFSVKRMVNDIQNIL